MSLIDKAREIAYEAHKGQVDKAGKPYTEHLEFVAGRVTTEQEKCVAYLHDVLEDTDFPEEVLKKTFPAEIFEAVKAMTHSEGEPYFTYIERISHNAIATSVKRADLTNNMMLERLPQVTAKDLERVEKYKKAYEMLGGAEK